MTRQEILQAQNNAKHYVYDLLGYFLTDEFGGIFKDDSAKIYSKLKSTIDIIDESTEFILKDMQKCDIIHRKKAI